MNIVVRNNFSSKWKNSAYEIGYYSYTKRCATFDQKTEMGNNIEKIFEILAEGGSIIGYRSFVGFEKDKRPNYLFNWTTNEIGLDDEGRFSSKSEMSKQNFSRFWKKIVQKYPLIYDLHPTFIHSEYQIEIAKNLRNKIQNGEDIYNLENWSRILEIPVNEIINKDYFD